MSTPYLILGFPDHNMEQKSCHSVPYMEEEKKEKLLPSAGWGKKNKMIKYFVNIKINTLILYPNCFSRRHHGSTEFSGSWGHHYTVFHVCALLPRNMVNHVPYGPMPGHMGTQPPTHPPLPVTAHGAAEGYPWSGEEDGRTLWGANQLNLTQGWRGSWPDHPPSLSGLHLHLERLAQIQS